MKASWRHSLVALLVLGLVVAIIWPLWQRPAGEPSHALDLSLPEEPVLPRTDAAAPVSDAELRAVEAQIEVARAQAGQRQSAGDNSLPLPEAWAVPVSLADNEVAARQQLQRLLDAGYHAFVRPAEQGWQLLAGPELDRALAEQTRQRLVVEGYLDGDVEVVPFSP